MSAKKPMLKQLSRFQCTHYITAALTEYS